MNQLKNSLSVVMTLIIAVAATAVYGLPISADLSSFSIKAENIPFMTGVTKSSQDASSVPDSEPNEEQSEEEVPESSGEQLSSETVPASAEGTAAGAIVKQFFSPYSAKYSYNNVYMKNSSGISIDIKEELNKNLAFKIAKSSEPQVLIMHTHATETYMTEDRNYYKSSDPSRSTDNNRNVTHVGEIVENKLKAAGFGVVHDRTQHDYPAYSGSYSRSEVTVKEYLKKYPSIKIVIDIHRDSISQNGGDKVKPVADINGKNAAQLLLCMGSQSGPVTGHPKWRENLRLALRFQQTLEVMYPGLARPLVLASKLYNQHLSTGSILLEVGTDANLLSEAEYSAELVGNALVGLLNTLG